MSDIATPTAEKATTAPQKEPNYEGRFIWYELLTTDLDAGEAFYRAVVGWTIADSGQQGMRYDILSVGDRGIGGAMQLDRKMLDNGARPGWLGYINVPDTDAMAKRVVQAGGSVHFGPDDIPDVGRFAMVADPGGAPFYLLSPLPQDEPQPRPEASAPGMISWHELVAANGEKAAFDFYSSLFGWQTDTEMDMGAMGKYRIFAKDGVQLGGMMDKPDNAPTSGWTFYINVDSIEAAAERIKANGGQVTNGPMEVPGGSWIVQGTDPQGAQFALVGPQR